MTHNNLPKWILIVSGIFALLEIMVSFTLAFAPDSMSDSIDIKAKGVDFLMYMWGIRQFALGFILAYATLKKSVPMLTIAYIFLLVMFAGDLLVGLVHSDLPLIISTFSMCLVAAGMLHFINKNRNSSTVKS